MSSAQALPTRARGRVDGLDALRGIAVALVMLRHAWPVPFAGAGVVGVVMFFRSAATSSPGCSRTSCVSWSVRRPAWPATG